MFWQLSKVQQHLTLHYWKNGLPLFVFLPSTYIMAILVVEFSNEGYNRFLPKNQHSQKKLLNFENWISGGLRSFQKSEF